MPNPAAEPPALSPAPVPGPGTVTLSTSLLGDLQVPGSPEQAATCRHSPPSRTPIASPAPPSTSATPT